MSPAATSPDDGPSPPPKEESAQADSTVDANNAETGGGDNDENNNKGWKIAASKVRQLNHVSAAVGKVKLENKIGTLASDLDDKDPLKVISLASQRALKSFGTKERSVSTARTRQGSRCVKLETDTNYDVRQPALECYELFHNKFKDIRTAFGITEIQYYAALELQDKATISTYSVIGSGDTAGKSPSFFFLSPDQRFILKSCTPRDVSTLSEILNGYRTHVESCRDTNKNNNSSILPRYIGLYELNFAEPPAPDFPTSVTLVCMTNFFAGTYTIHKKFDLKGSTHKRLASEKERAKSSPVFKDLDWLDEKRKLTFASTQEVDSIRQQLQKDTMFLQRENLIDYSLLVGVHEINKRDHEEKNNKPRDEAMAVISSRSDTEIQYFGIVDVLTPYVLVKRLETFCMGDLLCRPGISCQPPNKYQERFMEFVTKEVLAVSSSASS